MARKGLAAATAVALAIPVLVALPTSSAFAAPAKAPAKAPVSDSSGEAQKGLSRPILTLDGKVVDMNQGLGQQGKQTAQKRSTLAAADTPPVGTVRQWLGSDSQLGRNYRKDYVLRGVGQKIELWVAVDRAFPAGDCRNQVAGTTDVTDAQVASFIQEFDTNMYPKETATFSTPVSRDGTHAILGPDKNGNGGVYTGGGDKTVALVDNIRDANYYNFPAAASYTAGFFSEALDDYFDRNVMTIDVYDWQHRTGDNPPDNPSSDVCVSRPARPNTYEGTFAHEWQHLLESYQDSNEGVWLNEGLSDFAQTLTGYVDTTKKIDEFGNDSHVNCFQGWGIVQTPYNPNTRDCGGAQNSLNLWGEGGTSSSILADYGNAYELVTYLYDHFGLDIITRLHRDGALQGIPSVEAAVKAKGAKDFYSVLHDYQSMVLLDRIVGDSQWGIVLGADKRKVTSKTLRSTVNLANPQSYSVPGAAPNGADYVLLQKNGQPIAGKDLRSLKFSGVDTLPVAPLAWTLATDDPDRPGNSVLFSGNEDNLDVSAVTSVTVPATNPTLTFLAKYGAEATYDYGYVQVSTDGGATYTSIAGDKTVAGPLGPGLNGTTTGFEPHSFDLSAYAGKSILLSFRYVSDGGTSEGGLKIDDVKVGDTLISDGSSLAPFKSPTQVRPIVVKNYNVKLIGIDEQHAFAWQFEFNGQKNIALNWIQLALLSLFPKVVAVVAYDEPTEQVQQYAPYTLTVNGVTQPGGGGA
ncbi:immune inhibitor A [Dactylosporangium vinaceum]|uniref:Choice-of-anchor J domain-containing protein n=1 Tax=Dactylosporangium vinaceum TaxID=53362 RepID=A0ABV5MMG3_9ACTN|nr:choice-of-anchor J domain-containing protein [Dactylosporangium vinaceum]UAB93284.1 immune inhibitor A [Dactylosporangium vinaceum]